MIPLLKERGISFKNKNILEQALTHRSFVHENKMSLDQSNERLEFLGDAVLGITIAELLIREFPQEDEGKLSKRRAALVNQKQLASLAETLNLGASLRLGKGEEKTGGRTKKSLLCDAFEAMVGAIYLDQGMSVAREFIEKIFRPLIPDSTKIERSQDYKTRLQEHFQREFKKSPKYHVISETGPDHSKTFEVTIEFNQKTLATGRGQSKREAEQDAARNAFALLPPDENRPVKKRRSRRRPRKAEAV